MDFFLSCGSKSAPDSSMIYYFRLAQKGTRKHTQYFKLLFFQVNPHFCTWNQISTSRKTKFTSCNLTCHGLFFPRNAGNNHTDQSILLAFYSVWQESTHKPSKIEYAKKNVFSIVYVIGTTCFDEWKWMKEIYFTWKATIISHTRAFCKQRVFSTQPHCCVTFTLIELQILLRCFLIHISIIIPRNILFTIFMSI